MGTKRATKQITEEQFPKWLRAKIGDQTITDFAKSIGFKRQRLSNILNGASQPGAKLLQALKKYGIRRAITHYEVDAD
jgi:hypothetical protein